MGISKVMSSANSERRLYDCGSQQSNQQIQCNRKLANSGCTAIVRGVALLILLRYFHSLALLCSDFITTARSCVQDGCSIRSVLFSRSSSSDLNSNALLGNFSILPCVGAASLEDLDYVAGSKHVIKQQFDTSSDNSRSKKLLAVVGGTEGPMDDATTTSSVIRLHKSKTSGPISDAQASKAEARAELDFMCNSESEYKFVDCFRKDGSTVRGGASSRSAAGNAGGDQTSNSSELEAHFGIGGGGVKTRVLNDGAVTIYKNCKNMRGSPTQPHISDSCKLQPMKPPYVTAFMKVIQKSAEQRNSEFSQENTVSALEKEIRRTRAGARLLVHGIPYGTGFYDIVGKDGKWHSLHSKAFLQEFVDGSTTFNVMYRLLTSNIQSVQFYARLILRRYAEFVDTQEDFPKDHAQQAAEWARVLELTDTANEEVWLRFRLLLSLVYTVFKRASDSWAAGYFHCDMHSNNIMHLYTYVQDSKEALRILKSGEGFTPDINVRYTSSKLSANVQAAVQSEKGMRVVMFKQERVRYVDLGLLLSVKVKTEVNLPCKTLRPSAQEDLNDIIRTVSSTAFNVNSYNLPDIDSFPEMQRLQRISPATETVFASVKNNWARLQSVVSDINMKIESIPEVLGCRPATQAAIRAVSTGGNVYCTNWQMQEGMRKMLAVIREVAHTSMPVPVFIEH